MQKGKRLCEKGERVEMSTTWRRSQNTPPPPNKTHQVERVQKKRNFQHSFNVGRSSPVKSGIPPSRLGPLSFNSVSRTLSHIV